MLSPGSGGYVRVGLGMGESGLPLVSVMIATRNRVALLQRALGSVVSQDYPRVEILIADDASEDGTSGSVRSQYPGARLFRFEENRGLVVARNVLMREAKGEYIVSLDDDAYFLNADAISNVVRRMQQEPEIGVVTFQIRQPGRAESDRERVEHYTHLFGGGRHCLRRAVLEDVGGYREFFFHQGEESDLSLHLLDKGYRILFFPGATVFHEKAGMGRDSTRIPKYTIRNLLLRSWLNEPFPWWVLSTGNTIARCVAKGARAGNLRHVIGGFWSAIGEIPRVISLRRPVSSRTVWLYLALRRGVIADTSAIRSVYQDPPRGVRNLFG